jgi:hypothetical protein
MDSSRKIGVVAALTVVVGVVAFVVSFLSAGVGHGSYLPFAIFFPYSFLATVLLGGGIGDIAGTLTLAQFPVYGLILGRAWLRDYLRRRAAFLIIAHVVVAAICTVIFFTT